MPADLQPADLRLRRVTAIVLVLAAIAAIVVVLAFQHWMTALADRSPAEQLVMQLRRGIAFAMLAIGICVLLLAGYSARLAERITKERRWPLASTRVLRDTPIRRDEAATRIAGRLNAVALMLILLAVATAALSWRLFSTVS